MKKLLRFLCLAILGLSALSCYDDTALRESIAVHEDRLNKLETTCADLNTEIESLKTLVQAIQSSDYITSVVPLKENGKEVGYTITFAKNGTITIRHGADGKNGADGKDGANGKDGADGKDGSAPVIGVKKDTDGVFYWTINGEWLVDDAGNKVPVSGKDGADGENGKDGAPGTPGADGVTPQLKIEQDYWYVSYDGGNTWNRLGKATGENGKDGVDGEDGGDSIFQNVYQEDGYVYFVLVSGVTYKVPVEVPVEAPALDIVFDVDQGVAVVPGVAMKVNYTVVGGDDKTIVRSIVTDGAAVAIVKPATSSTGQIIIYVESWFNGADDSSRNDELSEELDGVTQEDFYSSSLSVLISVSDGKNNVICKALNLTEGVISSVEDAYVITAEGGTVTAHVKTNVDYQVRIPETVTWLSYVPATKAEVRTDELAFAVQANESRESRSAQVDLVNAEGSVLESFMVVQDAVVDEPIPPVESKATIASVLASEGAIPEGTKIEAVVVSNMALNNLTSKKTMYVQDETGALQFYLAANHDFAFGDKVAMDLSGVTIGYYNGAVQISGLALEKITLLSEGNIVQPKTVTVDDFLANKYEGQYVAIEGVQVAAEDKDKTFVMGGAHTNIKVETADGKSFVVFSSKYATFGASNVPQGSGTIKGIASINNGNPQIIFAQTSDYEGLTGTRFDGNEGGDTPVPPVDEPEGPVAGEGTEANPYDAAQAQELASALADGEKITGVYVQGTVKTIKEVSTSYGNATYWITDDAGTTEFYVYRGYALGNVKFTSADEIQVGDKVVLYGDLMSYKGNSPQLAQGNYIVKLERGDDGNGDGGDNTGGEEGGDDEGGQTPTPPAEDEDPYESNISWTLGANAYDNTSLTPQNATVNGVSVDNLLKLGTSSKVGDATFHIPAGTAKIGFYCVAWKGKTANVKFSVNGTELTTIAPAANVGATGNPPYVALNVADSDYYEVEVSASTATDVKVETLEPSNGRVIFIGIKAIAQ